MGTTLSFLPALRSLPPDLAAQLSAQAGGNLGLPPPPPPPAPAPAAASALPQPPGGMPGMPNLHPVRNAILGLLAGGPAGLVQQLHANDDRKLALQRMQSVYETLPEEYRPLFLADPQGFLGAYMKNLEPQKLAEGEMTVFGGGRSKVLNPRKVIDDKSGKPVYLTEAGPVAFDSLGGDIKAENGLVVSSRTGVQGAYSTPQKLQMGESPGSFTPSVTGVGQGGAPPPPPSRPSAARAPARGQVADAIRQRAAEAGLSDADAETLVRMGQIESGLNPNAPNNGSSQGLFQFHSDTFSRLGGQNIKDPNQQIDAAIRLYKNNGAALKAAGLPVTPATLYLSHQQGLVGARALLEADPGVPAAQVLASVYMHQYEPAKAVRMAQLAVTGNGGKPNMTAGQFVQMWNDKVGGVKTPTAAADGSTPASESAPSTPASAPGWSVGQPVGSTPGGPGSDLTGDAFLKTLPGGYAAQVRAIAHGDLAMPTSFVMKTPYGQKLINDVMQYDPTATAVNLPTRIATRKAFTSGSAGANLRNLNTVVNHLASLHDSIAGLRNFSGLGTMLNGPTNAIYGATDPSYQKAVERFNAARSTVASDLVSALTGGGGALHDREGWMKILDPNKSPDSLYSAVQEAASLIESRVDPMRSAYQQGMGTTDDPFQVMFPKGAAALERMRTASGEGSASGPQSGPTPGAIGEGAVAVGPGGHRIVLKGGAWRDAKTGAVVH